MICSVQYSINVNTVDVDPHSDSQYNEILTTIIIYHYKELPDDLINQLNELNKKMEDMMNWKDEMINKVDYIINSIVTEDIDVEIKSKNTY